MSLPSVVLLDSQPNLIMPIQRVDGEGLVSFIYVYAVMFVQNQTLNADLCIGEKEL